MRPDAEIAGIARGQAALARTLDRLTADDLTKPSLLPDWTVAHVLAHLARNADSVVRRLQAAIDGEVVEQYVGGAEGRAAGIEESAGLPLDQLVADVRVSSAAAERICAQVPDGAWTRINSVGAGGVERDGLYVVYSRWREVEIHHVDLGLDYYTPADWPDDFVQRVLPDLLESLPQRTDSRQLIAWMLGRAGAPQLESWG